MEQEEEEEVEEEGEEGGVDERTDIGVNEKTSKAESRPLTPPENYAAPSLVLVCFFF